MKTKEKKYYLKEADRLGWGPQTAKINPTRGQLIASFIKGQKVLDVGCGSGIWVNYFSCQGFTVTGIDFVEGFITKAREKYRGKFIVAKAQKLPFKKQAFETVLLINSLEHLDDEGKALEEAKRVGRRLILIVPQKTPDNIAKRGLVFRHHLDRTHRRVYTKRKLRQLLEKSGFQIQKIIETERLPAISVFPELFRAPRVVRRIITRLFLGVFKEKNYYLELLVVADKK